MEEIADGIHTWSVFSEEKGLDFHGYYLSTGGSAVLVDPVEPGDGVLEALEQLHPRPGIVLLTNKDHFRAAETFRDHFWAQLAVHELEDPLLPTTADSTFADGDLLLGALEVIHIPGAKTPGECAFYFPRPKALVLGDVLIGKPSGELSMMAPEKYADPELARRSLRRLLDYDVDLVLVGDGDPILAGGGDALRRFLEA